MKNLVLALLMCLVLAGVAGATVNINTASKEELTSLKGVGDKRAQEIIDYRRKNGDFKSVDDLEKVPGIGPGIMKQIRSQVSVSGKTTVDKPAEKAKTVEPTKANTPDPAKPKGTEAKKADAPKAKP
jgi:competence protein ComEA